MTRFLPSLLLAGALVSLGPATAFGQEDFLEGNLREREALRLAKAGRFIEAREEAEAILAEGPSFLATVALAEIHHKAQGNLPRSLFLVRQAEAMLLERFGNPPEGAEARQWHARLLEEQIDLLGGMDRRQDQLVHFDRYKDQYGEGLEVRRIWPLFKLGRIEEARALGERLADTQDPWTALSALNSLMAMASEEGLRQESLDYGLRANRAASGTSRVVLMNLAECSMECFRFADVPRYIAAAVAAGNDASDHPLGRLVVFHLLRGEFGPSLQSLATIRTEPLEFRFLQQHDTEHHAHWVHILIALGRFEDAAARSQRLVDDVNRVGFSSVSREIAEFVLVLPYWAARLGNAERQRERRAVRSFTAFFADAGKRITDTLALARQRRRAMRLAAEPALLASVVRPYLTEAQPWLAGTLIDLLGEGLVTKAVAAARDAEREFADATRPYFDALDGEIASRKGRFDVAVRLGRSALADLPADERLMRGRVLAWLAEPLWETGNPVEAVEAVEEALHLHPAAFRLLGASVPVEVFHDGDPASEALARKLDRSPRFEARQGGLRIDVTTGAEGSRICLANRAGNGTPRCNDDFTRPGEDDGPDELVDAFHDAVFAADYELTPEMVGLLDGRRVSADAQESGHSGEDE